MRAWVAGAGNSRRRAWVRRDGSWCWTGQDGCRRDGGRQHAAGRRLNLPTASTPAKHAAILSQMMSEADSLDPIYRAVAELLPLGVISDNACWQTGNCAFLQWFSLFSRPQEQSSFTQRQTMRVDAPSHRSMMCQDPMPTLEAVRP